MRLFFRGLFLMIFCQVVLESFPISSSGHFELLEKILQSFGIVPITASLPGFFDHFLHGPTFLIMILFFWKDWFSIFRFLVTKFSFSYSVWSVSYKRLWAVCFKIAGLSFIPVAITIFSYFLLKVYLKNASFWTNENLIFFGFLITTIALFSLYFYPSIRFFKSLARFKKSLGVSGGEGCFGNCQSQRIDQSHKPPLALSDLRSKSYRRVGAAGLNFKKAAIIGLVQGISFLPGISRFGTTYVAARWLGVTPRRAFQFSFLIQFPLVFVAFSDAGVRFLFDENMMQLFDLKVWAVFLLATILAFFALAISYSLAMKEKLWYLGFYMLIPLLTLLYFLFFVSKIGF